jgi:arylsulfatase A-like enzyme
MGHHISSTFAQWEKFTNWEFGTRVPLIIRAPDVPGSAGRNVSDIVSLVDVFPTLAELAGIPVPSSDHLDGTSLAPLLNSSAPANASAYALSVYPRCPASANASLYWQDNDCMTTERTAFRFMGLSLRTPRWRYTEWLPWNASLQADWYTPGAAAGVELYDHAGDDGTTFDGPWEQANLAGDPAHAAVQAQLAATLHAVYPNTPAWQ